MHHSDLYVFYSNYEEVSNMLSEIIYVGALIVSTKHSGGTMEILDLTNQVDSYVD